MSKNNIVDLANLQKLKFEASTREKQLFLELESSLDTVLATSYISESFSLNRKLKASKCNAQLGEISWSEWSDLSLFYVGSKKNINQETILLGWSKAACQLMIEYHLGSDVFEKDREYYKNTAHSQKCLTKIEKAIMLKLSKRVYGVLVESLNGFSEELFETPEIREFEELELLKAHYPKKNTRRVLMEYELTTKDKRDVMQSSSCLKVLFFSPSEKQS